MKTHQKVTVLKFHSIKFIICQTEKFGTYILNMTISAHGNKIHKSIYYHILNAKICLYKLSLKTKKSKNEENKEIRKEKSVF